MLFSTDQFSYNKKFKVLLGGCVDLGINGYPEEFNIKSSKTQKTINFSQDVEAFINNEGWDGEQMVYISPETQVKVVLTPY